MNWVNPAIVNRRESDRNLFTPFAIIWKPILKITFFSLNTTRTTRVLNILNNGTRNNLKNTNTLKFYKSDEPAEGFTETWFELWTEASTKRQSVKNGLNLSVRENLDKKRLTPIFSRILYGSLLFVDDLFSVYFRGSLYFLFALLFARYSSFYVCLLLFSFAFFSPYSAFFQHPFQLSSAYFLTRFTSLTSCFLWSLCLFRSSQFSLKTLSSRTGIITISSGWQSVSSAGIVGSWLENAKYWELLFNHNLTSLISCSKRGM